MTLSGERGSGAGLKGSQSSARQQVVQKSNAIARVFRMVSTIHASRTTVADRKKRQEFFNIPFDSVPGR